MSREENSRLEKEHRALLAGATRGDSTVRLSCAVLSNMSCNNRLSIDNLPGELAELGGEGVAPAACSAGGKDGHLGGSQQAT